MIPPAELVDPNSPVHDHTVHPHWWSPEMVELYATTIGVVGTVIGVLGGLLIIWWRWKCRKGSS